MRYFTFLVLLFITSIFFGQIDSSKVETQNQRQIITTGEPIYLKYVDATITPPPGYLFLEDHASFLNKQNQTSFSVVSEKGMSYQSFIDNMLKRDYSVGSAKLLDSEKIEEGYLFTFLFEINKQPVERVVYVTGTQDFTIWVTANYKQSEKSKLRDLMIESLLTIKF